LPLFAHAPRGARLAVISSMVHRVILGGCNGQRGTRVGRDAGSRVARRSGTPARTSGTAMAAPPRNSRTAPRPTPPPVHHPRTALGNTDASRSFAAAAFAGDSTTLAGHGQTVPPGCSDSAVRPHAAIRGAPADGTHRCSNAARGRSRCTPAPRPGSLCRRTLVRSTARSSLQQQTSARSLEPRARAAPTASLDLTARRCNTLPALVADTVGRGGRNNLPVIAAAAPVLSHHAVLPPASHRRPAFSVGTRPVAPGSTHPACS
jgi:hypothetical protein